MTPQELRIFQRPSLRDPRLLIGFSGWMDGGEVSTGTIRALVRKLNAHRFAEIEPAGFYIYSFPAMMEVAALFRPHVRIHDGLVSNFEFPRNPFFFDEGSNLVLLLGKEPNLQWERYAECVFSLCGEFGVRMIYFIGSVAGLVPHTREPRLFCSASSRELKDTFAHYGVNFSEYEGPASIVTYLTASCAERGLDMVSFVASVPAYVQGSNPKCIEAVTRRVAGILDISVALDDLSLASEEFERRLNEVVQEQPELEQNIRKLEEDYDNQIFDKELGELKHWLEQQGIRLD